MATRFVWVRTRPFFLCDAVMKSPQWSSTAIVLTWDDFLGGSMTMWRHGALMHLASVSLDGDFSICLRARQLVENGHVSR